MRRGTRRRTNPAAIPSSQPPLTPGPGDPGKRSGPMEDTGDDSRVLETEAGHSTFDGEDIYAEDGSIRSDFLMHVGAAIADGDLLFLRRHVARLHESEMGDLLEAIQPE